MDATKLDNDLTFLAVTAYLKDEDRFVERDRFFTDAKGEGFREQQIADALNVLEKKGILSGEHSIGEGATALRYGITYLGLHNWLKREDKNYEKNLYTIGSAIESGAGFNFDVAAAVKLSLGYVNHAFDFFRRLGKLTDPEGSMGGMRRSPSSAELRRWLDERRAKYEKAPERDFARRES